MSTRIDVLIIRGAPGSGKSRTAKSLSEYFPGGVRLEVDTIRNMLISVDWKNQKEHIDMLDLSRRLVVDFLQMSYHPVIVVDTFSGDKVNRFIEALQESSSFLNIVLIGLYTSESELMKRLDERKETEFKDLEISRRLNSDVLKWKHKLEFQIDTTGLEPRETARRICNVIDDYL